MHTYVRLIVAQNGINTAITLFLNSLDDYQ